MITRRQVLIAGSWITLSLPLVSSAQQQPRIWRIGYLDPRSPATSDDYYAAFMSGMRERGHVEGKDFLVERRFGDGSLERMRRAAAELVRLNVDVIVTDASPATRAVIEASGSIPVVVAAIGNPVARGFAKSLARPGGNVTGISNLSEEIYGKRLEILISVVPKANRIAFLTNPENDDQLNKTMPLIQAMAKQSGRSIVVAKANTLEGLDSAFALMDRERVGAVIIGQDAFLSSRSAAIAKLAIEHRLPSVGGRRQVAEAGALLSYGVDYMDTYRRAATYVDKILKGAKAGDLPIEQPTKFELVINHKTAKAIGITIPQELLLRADKVIE